MIVSSRTPEGDAHECPICHKFAVLEPSYPNGDSTCPACGHLLWFFRDRVSKVKGLPLAQIALEALLQDDLNLDSLDLVELVMELEEKLPGGFEQTTIPDDVIEQFRSVRSVRDLIEYLRRLQEGSE